MFRRSLSSAVTCLVRKDPHVMNVVYCSASSYDSVHEQEAKCPDSVQIEEDVKRVKLNERKMRNLKGKTKKSAIGDDLQSIHPNLIGYPQNILKSLKNDTKMLYLIDENVAERYVSLIRDDLLKNACFVAELNPGFGILTKRLLEAGVPLIHLYEAKKDFYPFLEGIHGEYPGRLDVRNFNLISIGQMLYRDRDTDGKQIEELFQNVESKKWEDETNMQIVGATNNAAFFRHLINSVIFSNCFMSNGRPVFYIMIPPSFWIKYTCDTSNKKIYTSLKVMFQSMFHYELLGTVERKAFLPFPRKKKKTKRISIMSEAMAEDYEYMYVVKLEPRSDLYSVLPKKDWIIFWYFVRHHMRKRMNRLIPDLEKWVPGCGIRLIAKDYTIFTQFGDLTPTQILEVFKEFKSWPEYKESYFLASMNETLSTYNEPALLDLKLFQLEE